MFRPLAALAVLLAFGLSLPVSADEPAGRVLYKWVDENGIPHYTTDLEQVPPALRRKARRLQREQGTGSGAAPDAGRATPGAGEPWMRTEAHTVVPPPPPPPVAGAVAPAAGNGGAGAPSSVAVPPTPVRSGLDAEIAALEAELKAEEERVKALISDPSRSGSLADDPELRAAAERLPRLQARLRALRAERGAGAGAPRP